MPITSRTEQHRTRSGLTDVASKALLVELTPLVDRVTRREKFLAEMERIVPWAHLIAVNESLYPKTGRGGPRAPTPRPPSALNASSASSILFGLLTPLNFRRAQPADCRTEPHHPVAR